MRAADSTSARVRATDSVSREPSPPDPLSTRHGPGLLVSPHPPTPSPQSGEGERWTKLGMRSPCSPRSPRAADEPVHLVGDASAGALLASLRRPWVVARGDTLTLPEMGDRFKLTDLILDTARVAVGRTCHYKGALVFAVPRAETLAVTWYGSPEQALIYGWPATWGRLPASAQCEWATHSWARSCSTRGSAYKYTRGDGPVRSRPGAPEGTLVF